MSQPQPHQHGSPVMRLGLTFRLTTLEGTLAAWKQSLEYLRRPAELDAQMNIRWKLMRLTCNQSAKTAMLARASGLTDHAASRPERLQIKDVSGHEHLQSGHALVAQQKSSSKQSHLIRLSTGGDTPRVADICS